MRFSENIRLVKAMGLSDYVHLMMKAQATLSDSGTITEESSILNFRALNIREAHERPEGMEEGAVMMTGLNPELRSGCVECAGGTTNWQLARAANRGGLQHSQRVRESSPDYPELYALRQQGRVA